MNENLIYFRHKYRWGTNWSASKFWKHFSVKLAEFNIDIKISTHLWMVELYTVYCDDRNWLYTKS